MARGGLQSLCDRTDLDVVRVLTELALILLTQNRTPLRSRSQRLEEVTFRQIASDAFLSRIGFGRLR
ncbi:hypothetical protein [Baaleninema simplex]|uniref:hypothetical protein n=1 Tax=Baaleninema simplex TaxID=2862350 RepID=UPI001C555F19|nr:hypothetical protein [Baaleninema simplex]